MTAPAPPDLASSLEDTAVTIVSVTTNLANTTACVVDPSMGVSVVSTALAAENDPSAGPEFAFCRPIAPNWALFNGQDPAQHGPSLVGIGHAYQLETSSLFAVVGDGIKLSPRILRVFDSGVVGPNTRRAGGATARTSQRTQPRFVAELVFRDSIIDVQWTRHNLVVVLSRSVNVFASRTLKHRHRITTRRQRTRSTQRRRSVVKLCPFGSFQRPDAGRATSPDSEEYWATLVNAEIEDLLLVNARDAPEGSLSVLGLAGDQLHEIDTFRPHSAEVAMVAVNPLRGLVASVSSHGQLIRISQLPRGKAHSTCKLHSHGDIRVLNQNDEVVDMAFHPSGRYVAALLHRKVVTVFRVGLQSDDVPEAKVNEVTAPSGNLVASVVRGIVRRVGGSLSGFLRRAPAIEIPVKLGYSATPSTDMSQSNHSASSNSDAGLHKSKAPTPEPELATWDSPKRSQPRHHKRRPTGPVFAVMLRDMQPWDDDQTNKENAGWKGWSEQTNNAVDVQTHSTEPQRFMVSIVDATANTLREYAVDLSPPNAEPSKYRFLRSRLLVDRAEVRRAALLESEQLSRKLESTSVRESPRTPNSPASDGDDDNKAPSRPESPDLSL